MMQAVKPPIPKPASVVACPLCRAWPADMAYGGRCKCRECGKEFTTTTEQRTRHE